MGVRRACVALVIAFTSVAHAQPEEEGPREPPPPESDEEPQPTTGTIEGSVDVQLEAGAYAVTIEHNAYKPWTRDIVVTAGEAQTVNVSLERTQVAIAPPDAKPPAPPEIEIPPVRTPVVAANAVSKLSGEIPKLKSAGGASNGDALAKMCIDESGNVTSVKIVKSTAAAIAGELQSALLTWRYKPYVNKDGETQPVCFPLSLRLVFKRAG